MNIIRRISYFFLFVFVCDLCAQSDYIVEPLRLNSSGDNEIFAISYRGGVIFCTDRRLHVMVNRVDTTYRPLFHLFYASMNDEEPQLLSRNIPINSHQGTCTVSADGNEIFFAANDANGQRIYSALRSVNEWIGIQPFAHNRANYVTTNPSLSRDGTRLFFASDMPGGYGGFDIYVSERTARGWDPPKNLGPKINTSGNELYPFIQGNGDLFFSSSGHGSMGGLDIFIAREINGEWNFVQRLEEPFNSIADDISYTSINDGLDGFWASNRDGNTFNIYSFTFPFPQFPDYKAQEENDHTYEFYEGGVVTDSTSFILTWNMGDGTVKYGEKVVHTYASKGTYEIFLNVMDTLTNEVINHAAHYILELFDLEQPYILSVAQAEAGELVSFDASQTYLPDIEIDDYYWILGDGTRKKGIRTEHVYTSPGVYRVQLGVIGTQKYVDSDEQVKISVYREITVY